MIVVTSNYLKSKDKALLRKYAKFVMNRMVRRGVQNKSRINVKVVSQDELSDWGDVLDLRKYQAWCTYDGVEGDIKKFTVILNVKNINRRAKNPLKKFKNLMVDLGHELTHVKQYLNNEIFDYKSGEVRYKGSYFDSSYQENEEKYYDSPWEIEAYGREWGLYKMFCNKMNEESRE